jgi:hypothetical protein
MALETPTQPQSRRALLGAAIGAAAATVAQALGRPSPVAGADTFPLIIGESNLERSTTALTNNFDDDDVLYVTSVQEGTSVTGETAASAGTTIGVKGIAASVSGTGVYGFATSATGYTAGTAGNAASPGGAGMWGWAPNVGTGAMGISGDDPGGVLPNTGVLGVANHDSSSRGVVGLAASGTGVHGFAGDSALPAPSTKTGVYGRSDVDANARGVAGYSGPGTGVYGSTSNGVAVLGLAGSSAGFGLKSTGRVSLSKASGVATIGAGGSSVTVSPGIDIVTGTYILLTPQADPGTRRIWATMDTTANSITIHVSSAVAGSLKVAWLALG